MATTATCEEAMSLLYKERNYWGRKTRIFFSIYPNKKKKKKKKLVSKWGEGRMGSLFPKLHNSGTNLCLKIYSFKS